MGGQVLGGGVIVAVAVALWLIYLLPSWHGRHQFNAAERNAVRLNQALRVLAETSQTPQEVRLELNARTAHAQQRLARQVQTEREQAELTRTRAELKVATAQAKAEAAAARERAAAHTRAEKARPELRRARARRRARLMVTGMLTIAAGLAGWGGVQVAATGSQLLLWTAGALAGASLLALRRMSAVRRRTAERVVETPAERTPGLVQDVPLAADRAGWTPRELPRPLTASAGSRAAGVLDAAAARDGLRRARLDEGIRARAQQQRPPSLAAHAARRAEEFAGGPGAGDEAIEAHVRNLLQRRASGQ